MFIYRKIYSFLAIALDPGVLNDIASTAFCALLINIQTPDAQSFQRSQSQVAALMARAVSRGQRNL